MPEVPTKVLVKLLRTVAKAMTEAADDLHKLAEPERLAPSRSAESPRPPLAVPKPPASA